MKHLDELYRKLILLRIEKDLKRAEQSVRGNAETRNVRHECYLLNVNERF